MRFRQLTQQEIDDIIWVDDESDEEVPTYDSYEDFVESEPNAVVPGNEDESVEDPEDIDIA